MANYSSLKSAVTSVIKTNGNKEITGAVLQSTLLAIINSLGDGFLFKGVATTSTNPGTPDQNVFYIGGAGTYTHFNSLEVPTGYLGVLKYNGVWAVSTIQVGAIPINNLTTGGATVPLSAEMGKTLKTYHDNNVSAISQLRQEVDLKIDGVGATEKDIIWADGYANYAKKITADTVSQFSQPILLKAGETILYKSSRSYSCAIVSVPNGNPVSIGDTLSGNTLLVYDAQKIGTTEQYTATRDVYIVISVSKADREISFLAYNENSVVSQIERLPLNLENRGVCDKFEENTAVTNNYITLLQGHKYRFTVEFKHPGTLGGSANLKLVSANSLDSVKMLINLGGQTISEGQKISEDLLWTDASVENYRLGFYDPTDAGKMALKDAIVTAKEVSTDALLDWMAESGKYPLTKVGFLSVHNNNVKIDFTSSTIVIPAYTRVIYKVSGHSYSATSNVATTLQRDSNYEQIICFNETSKEFVARGINDVQNDDYILFVIQNSDAYGKNRTTLSPSLYTIDGKAPFVMQSEGLYKTAQVLSDSEKTQVLNNLGIVWTKNGPTAEGFVSYTSKYGSVPKVSGFTDVFAITGVDLVKGHTYEAIIVAENTITAPSDFNLKICNNTSGSTIYRIMTLGGLTFSEKTARFVWDNETVNDYRVGFYGNGTVNTKIGVFLKDVSIDAVKDAIKVTPVVDWNRHKEAALISVASKSGNENIKVANKLTLLHFSDVHGNTANLANIVTYGDHYSDLLDDIIHTGDSVLTQMSDTNPFVSVEGAENILNVIGNHEAWVNTSDPDYYATEKQTYDKIFAPSIANWGVVQPAGAAENGYCYYYKDFTTAGFRLIVLDSVHWHYRDGISDSNPAQKSWFEGVLADAISQNLRVVCATHYTPQNGIVPVENTGFNVLGTTAGADIADGWYAADEIFGCVDTFIGNGGKFMGWLMGHTHNDYFGMVRNHTGQPIVVIGTSKGSGSANNKFVADTASQDNFNVITFENLDAKDYIKIVKIGQDTDIYTRSKSTICYNFTDGVLVSTT